MFSKFGHVNKLDFLFHKAGPLKGKPRGYAFIEYASDDVRVFPRSAILWIKNDLSFCLRSVLFFPLHIRITLCPLARQPIEDIVSLPSPLLCQDARKALTSANEKLLRGRKLVVTYANYAPTTDGARSTKSLMDNAKPTTLSMLKSGQSGRNADAYV